MNDEVFLQSRDEWIRQVLEHRPELERLARLLARGSQTEEDLVQDTLVAALSRPPLKRGRPMAWLRTVARNLAATRARRANWVNVDLESVRTHELHPHREMHPHRAETMAIVRQEVSALEEPYRTVVRMRFFEGLSSEAIAGALGRPLNTINSQLRRALRHLETRLDRALGESRSWRAALLALSPRAVSEREVIQTGLAGWGLGLIAVLATGLAGILWWSLGAELGEPVTVNAAAEVAASTPEIATPGARQEGTYRESVPTVDSLATEAESAGTLASKPLGSLELQVVDEADRAVAGAEVSIHREFIKDGVPQETRLRGTTNAGGRASIPLSELDLRLAGLPRCDFSVRHADHLYSGLISIPFPFERGPVGLELARKDLTAQVWVVDERGAPVANARVSMSERHSTAVELGGELRGLVLDRSNTTDSRGLCTLNLKAGQHPLSVKSAEHLHHAEIVDGTAGEDLEVLVTLQSGASLSGIALDSSGQPCPGARIVVHSGSAGVDWATRFGAADDLGRFRVAGLPDEEVWVVVKDMQRRIHTVDRLHLDLDDEQELTARLEPSVSVSILVQDTENAPVASALVMLMTVVEDPVWMAQVLTSDQGVACFPVAPRDVELRYIVFVDPEKNLEGSRDAARGIGIYPSEQPYEVTVDRRRNGASIAGRVLADPELIEHGSILIESLDRNGFVTTFESGLGDFRIEGLSSGFKRVHFMSRKFGCALLSELTLESDEAVAGNFELADPVELRCEWPWSQDLDELFFRMDWRGEIDDGVTTETHLWETRGPPVPGTRMFPGSYLLRVRDSGGLLHDGPVSVTSEGRVLLEQQPFAR